MTVRRAAPKRRRATTGFTLIEVLVAVVIVAIALAAGSRAAGTLIDNAQRLGDVTEAQWCAENQLVNLKLSRQYPDVGDSRFECSQRGVDYVGQMLVQGTPNPNFRRVEVTMMQADRRLVTLQAVVPRY